MTSRYPGDEDCPICKGSGYLPEYDERGYQKQPVPLCECLKAKNRKKRVARMLEESGLDKVSVQDWTWETFRVEDAKGSPKALAALAEMVAELKEWGKAPIGWRGLWGGYGCGKTHIAYAVADAAVRSGHSVFTSNAVDLLAILRCGFNDSEAMAYEERYQAIAGVDLLLIDDLGTEKGSEWANEQLYRLLDQRYREQRALLITTNLNLTSRSCPMPQRILSRLRDGSRTEDGFGKLYAVAVADYRETRRAHG